MGAAPRYRGSSDGWTLSFLPWPNNSKQLCGMRLPKDAVTRTLLFEGSLNGAGGYNLVRGRFQVRLPDVPPSY
jgi:hypothetical protein